MPRVIYTPRATATEVSLELATDQRGTTYFYRFYGPEGHRCSVHKLTASSPRDPVSLLAGHVYTVHSVEHVLAACNCPWMLHHPDSRCKHANLCVAVWAHWDALRRLYLAASQSVLTLPGLFAWKPGDPPVKFDLPGETSDV